MITNFKMPLHHRIVHHVRKHKERIMAHVQKHQKKYIFGAGVLSGRAITKFIALMVIFFGMSRVGGSIGADYYDVEFYNSRTGDKINISNIIDRKSPSETTTVDLYTGAIQTGQ